MAFCTKCGAPLPEGANVCPSCGAPAQEKPAGTGPVPESAPAGYSGYTAGGGGEYRREAPPRHSAACVEPGSVLLADGEVTVRTYRCASLFFGRTEGYLSVTNKRLVFQGHSPASRVAQEVSIDGISGLDGYYGHDISLGKIICGIIAIIIAFNVFGMSRNLGYYYSSVNGGMIFLGIVLLALGAFLIYLGVQKCFILSVTSSKVTGSGISIGRAPHGMLGNGALFTLTSRPTVDTDRMLNELGAIVQDLQTLGDKAIDKWR